ncbi:GNAT family N-acetyltransferase [Ruania albidiflava]|uniref:GNAT family N-acetyltransferase n=1 Tax=Ruania albidiflava TaxID=366586 RepID=UPI0003B4E44E|nr:GNAT family N-acetyltransferase [Ruania albidiflava]
MPAVRSAASARLATEDDLEAVVPVIQAARADSPLGPQFIAPASSTLSAQLRTWYGMSGSTLAIAEQDKTVTGFALARVVPPNLFSDISHVQLEALYVAQGGRRRGAGRMMVHQVALAAARAGAEWVVTMPLTGARSEQRFLSGLGFSPAGSRRVAETASLLRRLDPPGRVRERRPRALDELIARRRRSRGLPETPPGGVDLSRLADRVSQRESTSMHVNRDVHTRRWDSSSSTIS